MNSTRKTTAHLTVAFAAATKVKAKEDECDAKKVEITSTEKQPEDPIAAILNNPELSRKIKIDSLFNLLRSYRSLASLKISEATKQALFGSKRTLAEKLLLYIDLRYGTNCGNRNYEFCYVHAAHGLAYGKKYVVGPAGILGVGAQAIVNFFNTPSALRDIFTNEKNIPKLKMFEPMPKINIEDENIQHLLSYIPKDYFMPEIELMSRAMVLAVEQENEVVVNEASNEYSLRPTHP